MLVNKRSKMSTKFIVSMLSTLLIFTFVQTEQKVTNNNHCRKQTDCPTWMYCLNSTGNCTCGVVDRQIVLCNNKTQKVRVLDGYILTYETETMVEAGQTIYGWRRKYFRKRKNLYFGVEHNRTELNDRACGRFNREGRLCGKCKEGYSPLVYTYKLDCANCSNGRYNGVKFIAAAFIPLTAFYMFVVLFKFNANSPALQAYSLVAQTIGAPVACRYIIAQYGITTEYALISSFFGIWNLDFFRLVYPNICLNVSTLTALSLDYAIAVYPLFLIFLTYIGTQLYFRGYRIVVFFWKPFLKVFRLKLDNKSSLIDVMATFMLLSYNKVLSVSFDLLVFTRPFNLTGKFTGVYLYYDATVVYFGKQHLPYGIIAILFFLVFNILPFLLLFFYPIKWFQSCLNHLKLSHITLHIFVESFTGYYKDGTEPGTRDCRYFAAIFLLVRIIFYCALGSTRNISFSIIFGSACTIVTILFVVCKPYRARYSAYNAVTVVLFLVGLAFTMVLLGFYVSEIMFDQKIILATLITGFGAVPLFYIVGLAVWWIWKHTPLKRHFYECIKRKRERLLTDTTLFKAADSKSQRTQCYGAVVMKY